MSKVRSHTDYQLDISNVEYSFNRAICGAYAAAAGEYDEDSAHLGQHDHVVPSLRVHLQKWRYVSKGCRLTISI